MTLANRYVLDGAVAGELDTTSFTGQPMMALSVDGEAVDGATLSSTSFGHEVTAALPGSPDRTTRQLRLILPRVDVTERETGFAGLAVLATTASGIGGPATASGVLDSYVVIPVNGVASVLDF
jgi:hypothetical protein